MSLLTPSKKFENPPHPVFHFVCFFLADSGDGAEVTQISLHCWFSHKTKTSARTIICHFTDEYLFASNLESCLATAQSHEIGQHITAVNCELSLFHLSFPTV